MGPCIFCSLIYHTFDICFELDLESMISTTSHFFVRLRPEHCSQYMSGLALESVLGKSVNGRLMNSALKCHNFRKLLKFVLLAVNIEYRRESSSDCCLTNAMTPSNHGYEFKMAQISTSLYIALLEQFVGI